MIWSGQFVSAIDSCHRLIDERPDNPQGFFLLGMAYYSINNQYRNDCYADSVAYFLDTAIELAEGKVDQEKNQAKWYFVLGSAYGCRALYRSIHGGWWGAFRDGHHSCSNLERAFKIDDQYTDALSGIGAYHYWKSAKSGILKKLPFIGDSRKRGIAEIIRAVEAEGIMSISAQKSLLPIYFNEKRYADMMNLADSLAAANSLDLSGRLHLTRAFIELERWDLADRTLKEVQSAWESSLYYDACGAAEALYLKGRILSGRGDKSEANQYLGQLFSMDSTCATNAYFRQTLLDARALYKKLQD
ncbi:MAG: hypothetical protein A2W25_06065 [candidate division Zixibacteria bacterium RBG_16_53_22]|nr:MAG: hypothetical protein A2W25_06065 [candidate division Zixibacteria bacterium RBG_16_53_22]